MTSNDDLTEGILKSIEKRIQNLINEADVDGDGQINFLEFHEVMRKDSTNTKNTAPTPPTPPDGGWGWVIVFSCFMCNFLIGKEYQQKSIHYKNFS